MPKKRVFDEGDCIAVPLSDGGYAVGIVARADGKGAAVGYFFGPRYEDITQNMTARPLQPSEAVFVALFGDMGIRKGQWKVLGRYPRWQRDDWPNPSFLRVDGFGGRWRVTYSESDLCQEAEVEPITQLAAGNLPQDGAYGFVAVERVLASLLPV